MVFEYILKQNHIDPASILQLTRTLISVLQLQPLLKKKQTMTSR